MRDYREDPPVLGGVHGEIELGEDVSDVGLDGLARDEAACGDAAVAHALCHELENIEFAVGERAQTSSLLAVVGQLSRVEDAILEEVADAARQRTR
jgi:hypothetical protein